MTCRLYHGDCLEVMARLEDNSVNLTLTSPPYDTMRTYAGSLDWGPHVWEPALADLFRITIPGGVVVWIVADATIDGSETGTSFRQALYAKEVGFNLHDTMIWFKGCGKYPSPNRYTAAFEYMFVLTKGTPTVANLIKDRPNKTAGATLHTTQMRPNGKKYLSAGAVKGRRFSECGCRFNVWQIPPCQSSHERTGHPAQMSLRLARDHVQTWSNPGDVVCDPFMGSGTTGVAALREGRGFVGIEKEYYEIARRRIAHERAQGRLF